MVFLGSLAVFKGFFRFLEAKHGGTRSKPVRGMQNPSFCRLLGGKPTPVHRPFETRSRHQPVPKPFPNRSRTVPEAFAPVRLGAC